MKHNRTLAIIFTCVLVIAAVFIGLQGKPVGRDSSLYLTDQADVISPAVESQFVALQKGASPRLSVSIVRSTGKLSTADYCETLWENWRLGSSDLLLLMVTGKQDYYFGYDTSATYASLLDANFDVLMERYLEPDFSIGDYEQAILSFSDGLQAVLAGGYFGNELFYPDEYYDSYSSDSGMSSIFLLILVLAVIVIAVMAANSIGKTNRRKTTATYHTPTPPTGMPRHTGTYRTTTHTPVRPAARPVIRPRSSTSSLPRTTTFRPSTSSRPTATRSSSRSSFGGGGRSPSGGFGGGGRSSGGFGGGGRSGGMGGRGRR